MTEHAITTWGDQRTDERVRGVERMAMPRTAGGAECAAMTRRRYVGGAGSAIAGAALVACGAPGASAPQKLVKGPVEITWTFWATADNMPFFEETKATFERMYPEVKVNATPIAGNYDDAIITMVTGGTPPDAMATLRFTATAWAVKGVTLALDPFLARAGFKESEYFPNAITPWKVNGKLYALPREVDLWTLWYNKQMLQEAGIRPPDETWTWDTLIQHGQRLTRREGGKVQFGFAPNAYTHKMWVAMGMQNGTRLYDRESMPTRLLINQPAVTDALQWMADLRHKHRIAPTDDDYREHGAVRPLFQTGKLALLFGEASAAAGYANAIKDFGYDVAVPMKGKQHGTWLGGACYSVPKSTSKKDAGVQFVMFVSGTEGQKLIAKHNFGVPAIKQVADSDLFLKAPGNPQNKRAWRQAFDFGAGPPMTPMWGEIEAALNSALNETWAGRRNARDSVAVAWPRVEELLRQSQELLNQMPQ